MSSGMFSGWVLSSASSVLSMSQAMSLMEPSSGSWVKSISGEGMPFLSYAVFLLPGMVSAASWPHRIVPCFD